MRNTCLKMLAVVTVLSVTTMARGADHGDGSGVLTQPNASVDINDFFIWMNGAADRVNLALSVHPNANASSTFSDAVQYNFRLATYPDFATSVTGGAPAKRVRVTCTFDSAQTIECWVVDGETTVDYVTGDASDPAGITSAKGGIRVFAGLRNDPFFFNLGGFRRATATVYDAIAANALPPPDAAGCFALGDPTQGGTVANTLVGQLMSGCDDAPGPANPAFDFFDQVDAANNANCPAEDPYFVNQGFSGNILGIAIQLDKALIVDAANPVIGGWASTNM